MEIGIKYQDGSQIYPWTDNLRVENETGEIRNGMEVHHRADNSNTDSHLSRGVRLVYKYRRLVSGNQEGQGAKSWSREKSRASIGSRKQCWCRASVTA